MVLAVFYHFQPMSRPKVIVSIMVVYTHRFLDADSRLLPESLPR